MGTGYTQEVQAATGQALVRIQAQGSGSRFLLRTWDFGLIWWGQFIAQIGDGVTRLALLWYVYAITGSPLQTTFVTVLQTIPPIVLGPLLGVVLDHLPKKPVLIATDLTRAVLIGLVPCLVPPEAFTVATLYGLVFCNAIATTIFGPALYSAVPLLVPRPQLTAANGLLQATVSLGVVLGPALSGVGIALIGSQEVLCINAGTYLASAVCFSLIRVPRVTLPPMSPTSVMTSIGRDFREGLRFVFGDHHLIVWLILTAAFYSAGVSALKTLLPVFGKNLLQGGPVEVGYLDSAFGLGLLVVSLALVRVTTWNLSQRIMLLAVSCVVMASAVWSILAIDHWETGLLILIVLGSGAGILTPIEWGILQDLAPPTILARVLTLYGTGAMLAAIGGMSVFGWMAETFGDHVSIVGIGGILWATALIAVRFSRWLQRHPRYA